METVEASWFEQANDTIADDLDGFYSAHYPTTEIRSLGKSLGLEPCPVCEHKNCCRVTEFGLNCFSCGWKGNHVNAYLEYAKNILHESNAKAYRDIAEWTKIPLKEETPEMLQQRQQYERFQEIRRRARQHYHQQLLECTDTYLYGSQNITPMQYLTEIRQRKQSTIEDFQIGFVRNYIQLRQELLSNGYTSDEIKEAKVWASEGLIIYFYTHPLSGDIIRINTKNPFQIRDDRGVIIEGYSTGNKTFYYAPGFSFNKDIIVVEGENDVQAIYESEFKNVVGIGGNIKEELFTILEKAKKKIYAWFDNDDAGAKYLGWINEQLPEKDIYEIRSNPNYKDPDEFLINSEKPKAEIEALLKNALLLGTEDYKITHKNITTWTAENRFQKMEFHITGKDNRRQVIGDASLYVKGKLHDKVQGVSLFKCKAGFKPMNFLLAEAIDNTLNTEFENKSNEELAEIIPYAFNTDAIVTVLATRFSGISNSDLKNEFIVSITEKLKKLSNGGEIVDKVLKEANEIQNRSYNTALAIPRIKISQYFNIRDNVAYFYYTKIQYDGENVRKLPYLLRNDKQSIRLDLYKRKDEQCLLLIDSKYELVQEVPVALNSQSLSQYWVDKWTNDEIPPEELSPRRLIKQIENLMRSFYYTTEDQVYKVLALYAYLTYYYEAFGEVPYLYFNGEKGSGKSILDTIMSMFCFNAKMGVSMSEASLFRLTSVEGGTLILDEIENLTSRKSANESQLAPILKGGYTRNANIFRVDMDSGTVAQYDAFGPKIISNIAGLEDVVLDRCIQINSYRLAVTSESRMEDPRKYEVEHREELAEITSKCCLSALINFQKVMKIHREFTFESDNARLSQILTTMLAIAKLVDETEILSEGTMGEYETALKEYYATTIVNTKTGIDENTPEGILKKVVPRVAEELAGRVPPSQYELIGNSVHKYSGPIDYSLEEGWFELNALHIKCFMEEHMGGETCHTRYIPRYVQSTFRVNSKPERKVVVIENDELLKEFKGNSHPKVRVFRFYFRDFLGTDFLHNQTNTDSIDEDIDTDIY